VVGGSVVGAVGWSEAVMGGGAGWSDAVDGDEDDGDEVGDDVSDGVAVGSIVGVACGSGAGSVVGEVSDAQKASMDVDPDAASVSEVNADPVVASFCCCQSTHRSVVERAGSGADDVVDVDGSLWVRSFVDVVVVVSGVGVGDVDALGLSVVRSGNGAPMVRCATSCSGAGSSPVYAAAAIPPAPSVTIPATVTAANLPAINVETTATRRAP